MEKKGETPCAGMYTHTNIYSLTNLTLMYMPGNVVMNRSIFEKPFPFYCYLDNIGK